MRRLAERLGLTNELLNTLINEYTKDKHTTHSEAEQYICKKYVENSIVQMQKDIDTLKKAVNELCLMTNK